jgi:zinc carboxypeptidase
MKTTLKAAAAFLFASTLFAASAPTPSEFLKMTVGADRTLADYRQITSYFRALEKASPRVKIEVLGKTTLNEDMIMAVITSEENQKNVKAIQAAARKLADPRGVSEADLDKIARDGKVVLLVTCNIHASEIGSTQMAMEWAHALATADDAQTKKRLENVVLLLVPSLNPDGQIMETEWYRKNLGTRFEGSRMPWLYHHYVGHDNNRDWFQLTQKETRAMNRSVYNEWFPQVWLDEHQMGSTGPRIFVPPFSEPVSTEVPPLVWREINLIGSNMALRMEQAGKSGIIYGSIYDAYWPGGTMNTAWWKNISGLLTEVASVRLASPIEIAPGELAGGRKGLIEYGPQTNFPNPWPGGVWRLRDIMDYERIASDALLEECSERRADFLKDMATRSKASIAAFGPQDAYRIPMGAAQRDRASAAALAAIMAEHGAQVQQADNGDIWIPLAQPYGKLVREMFSIQRYPEVKLVAGKDIVRPYDVAAWSMPMMMGVSFEQASLPAGLKPYAPAAPKLPADGPVAIAPGSPENARLVNAALRGKGSVSILRGAAQAGGKSWPAGTIFLDAEAARAAAGKAVPGLSWTSVPSAPAGAEAMRAPRVGLYKPWAASMDEGWTRFLLEQYGFDPKPLDNKTIKAGKLSDSFDVVILPDVSKEIIATGKPRTPEGGMKYFVELPPEYAGGIDKEGAKALHEFVEGGGTLIAFSAANEWVTDEFNIPVVNTLSRVRPEDFGCPGSLLWVHVAPGTPLTYGLPEKLPIFQDKAIAFETAPPASEIKRWVLASYPWTEEDILASGWIHGADRLERKAAAVATTFGKGKLVLLGFRPQHRAQTPATFPFLFNALYWSTAK